MVKKPKGWLKGGWDETQAINDRLTSRAQRCNALFNNGGGSVSDYVHADFNTDCPNGLDTKPWADQFVKLESLFESPIFLSYSRLDKLASLRWGGWVQGDKDDTIHINPIWYHPQSLKFRAALQTAVGKIPLTMADIIPHEFIHTRQNYSDHSGWIRNNRHNDVDWVGMGELSKSQKMWRKAARTYHDVTTAIQTKAGTTSGYYANNVEMQARMHEILSYGYTQWQRLPTNTIELSAALVNLGLKAPASVLDELNSSEEGRKAIVDFKVIPSIKSKVSGTVSTFDRVHDYVGEPDVQQALWTAKYPLLYGELMEFYGDKLGRERMNMGTNPRPAIEVLYELKTHSETPLTSEKAKEMADRIPAPLAATFLNNLIIRYPEGADNFDNAMILSEAFLARNDVKIALFTDTQTARNYTGQPEEPPLNLALLNGHVTMTQLLMDAGANPFQRYKIVDMREKEMLSGAPVSCVDVIISSEKNLADPSRLPKEARKFFTDPKNREQFKKNVEEKRAALQVMLDYSNEPNAKHKLYDNKGNYEEVSLAELLSKIGISKQKNTIKFTEQLTIA